MVKNASAADQSLTYRPSSALQHVGPRELVAIERVASNLPSDRSTQERSSGYTGPSALSKHSAPSFSSAQLAKQAFFQLLRDHNVDENSTWKDAIKAVMASPNFRAIANPAARKAAFDEYVVDSRNQAEKRKQERAAQFRSDFRDVLSRLADIHHYSRWKTIRPMVESHPVFTNAKDEEERKAVFEEYAEGLWQEYCKKEDEFRKEAKQRLQVLFRTHEFTLDTTWEEAQAILEKDRTAQDILERISLYEIIAEYEKFSYELEKLEAAAEAQEKKMLYRKERKKRDAFKELLNELRTKALINDDSRWEDVFPLIEKESRFLDYLDHSETSSKATDLFEYFIQSWYPTMSELRRTAREVLDEKKLELKVTTSFDRFTAAMSADQRTTEWADWAVKAVYDTLRNRLRQPAEDNLRYVLKHLNPSIRSTSTYDEVRPRLENHPEYQDLDEQSRRAAFDQYIKRLRDHERESTEPRVSRDHRNDRSPRHRATNGRETNAYEEERQRATAIRDDRFRPTRSGRGDERGYDRELYDREYDRDGGRHGREYGGGRYDSRPGSRGGSRGRSRGASRPSSRPGSRGNTYGGAGYEDFDRPHRRGRDEMRMSYDEQDESVGNNNAFAGGRKRSYDGHGTEGRYTRKVTRYF